MNERSTASEADRLSKRRARILPFLAVIYLTQQASFCSALNMGEAGSAYGVKIAAWAVLSLVILMALVTKGFWFKPQAMRDMIDDENTRANRLEAIRLGFIVAILSAIGCYFVDRFEPLATGETVQVILSLGLGAALVRFGMLERRAHRDA